MFDNLYPSAKVDINITSVLVDKKVNIWDTAKMKELKFADPLAELIVQGEKMTTWRVDDDKDLGRAMACGLLIRALVVFLRVGRLVVFGNVHSVLCDRKILMVMSNFLMARSKC